MLRFGVISAYLADDWHSQRLLGACAARGRADAFAPSQFALRVEHGVWQVLAGGRDVRLWDVFLLPRALGEEGDHDFQCMVYEAIAACGVPVINDVRALLIAEDKPQGSWRLARAGVPTPDAVAVQTLPEALEALDTLGAAVAKPPYGSLGEGIVRVSRRDRRRAARTLAEMLRAHRVIYLQKLVGSERRHRDLRLFVVGDRVAAAVERVAAAGEFRTNVHLGGRPRAYAFSATLERLAVAAARAIGLAYAGVDVVETDAGPTVIEVNGTPRWEGILRATGRDMAEEIAELAASVAAFRARNRTRGDRRPLAAGGV